MRCILLLLVGLVLACLQGIAAQEKPKDDLPTIEKRIADAPDDPLLHYRRAQLLAKADKLDEAYAAAQTAMQKFIMADKELAWLMLESFAVDGRTVSVHFNMGPNERQPPKDGIARPLSFRVYNKAGTRIVDAFDFEHGYFQGKLLTAAFGKTTDEGHANYGPVDPKEPYSKIRAKAIELIKKMPAEDAAP